MRETIELILSSSILSYWLGCFLCLVVIWLFTVFELGFCFDIIKVWKNTFVLVSCVVLLVLTCFSYLAQNTSAGLLFYLLSCITIHLFGYLLDVFSNNYYWESFWFITLCIFWIFVFKGIYEPTACACILFGFIMFGWSILRVRSKLPSENISPGLYDYLYRISVGFYVFSPLLVYRLDTSLFVDWLNKYVGAEMCIYWLGLWVAGFVGFNISNIDPSFYFNLIGSKSLAGLFSIGNIVIGLGFICKLEEATCFFVILGSYILLLSVAMFFRGNWVYEVSNLGFYNDMWCCSVLFYIVLLFGGQYFLFWSYAPFSVGCVLGFSSSLLSWKEVPVLEWWNPGGASLCIILVVLGLIPLFFG